MVQVKERRLKSRKVQVKERRFKLKKVWKEGLSLREGSSQGKNV